MLSVVRKVLLIISPADSVSVYGPYLAPLTCLFSPPSSLTHSLSTAKEQMDDRAEEGL